MRLCECGCGQPLPNGAADSRRYLNSVHAKRAERSRARATLSGLKAAVRSGGPPPAVDPSPPPPTLQIEDRITTACEAAACLLRSFPNAESVTIHRDGSVSVLRVGVPGEAPQDALIDMARMGAASGGEWMPRTDCVGSSIEQRKGSRLDEFVASRMGGGR